LRGTRHVLSKRAVTAGEQASVAVEGELLDVRMAWDVTRAKSLTANVRGVPVVYNAERHVLTCKQHQAPLTPANGKIDVRILVDRGSVEIFGNGGRIAMSVGAAPDATNRRIVLQCPEGHAILESLEAYELGSTWSK